MRSCCTESEGNGGWGDVFTRGFTAEGGVSEGSANGFCVRPGPVVELGADGRSDGFVAKDPLHSSSEGRYPSESCFVVADCFEVRFLSPISSALSGVFSDPC